MADIEKSAETTNIARSSSHTQLSNKSATKQDTATPTSSGIITQDEVHIPAPNKLRKLNALIEGLSGFEARGITRVPPEERNQPSLWDDISVALLWFSANISVNNLTVGMFGPMIFGLGFVDSALCVTFGALLGSLSTAYMSIWGPQSGNRTAVVLRFFMGYWPAKLPTLLNIILMVGYCTIDAILGGQILSAVNGAGLSIAVGIVVVQIISWVVAVFGMKFFQVYERFSWIPQVLVLFILIGAAGPSFDTTTQSTGSASAIAANRFSFLSLCLYVPNSWGAAASDFYVYYPEKTSKFKVFTMTLAGLWTSFTLVFLLGVGLATGLANNESWAAANTVSTGALIIAAYGPLGSAFGGFCAVIIALGVISNSIPGTYSAALGFQVLGRYGKAVPRWVWSCILILIQLILALAGKEHLMILMQNFLALMGYWIELMFAIVIIEHLVFRRGKWEIDWARWEDKSYLPIGFAALASFLSGWGGCILGMYQVSYTGPIAKMTGLADVGLWVGTGFTIILFVPLRWFELRIVGR